MSDREQPAGSRIERRSAQRVAVDMFVQERDGDRLFVHPATNLSETGIFIESHSYSLRNALERRFIDLEFELPDGAGHSPDGASRNPGGVAHISVRGEVIGARRVRGFSHGLAVRFLDLPEADRKRLGDFVATRLSEGAAEGHPIEAAPTL